FSSRRRHTRWPRDWSSDVCSSDLPRAKEASLFFRNLPGVSGGEGGLQVQGFHEVLKDGRLITRCHVHADHARGDAGQFLAGFIRSEERRVGKEGGCGGGRGEVEEE